MRRAAVVSLVIVLFAGSTVHAGFNPDAKAAVHVLPHDATRSCSKNFPDIQWCEDILTTFDGCGDVDVFPVFFDLIEYQGLEYGLVWPGSESCAFTSCSDLHIGQLVNSGDGISHAWYVCHADPVVVTGWGWLPATEYGMICLIDHPTAGGINIGDCRTDLDQVVTVFCAGVCGQQGHPPCGAGYHPMNITKTDGLSGGCVMPGDSIAYSIVYDNLPNNADVHNVIITDLLPGEVEYVSASDGGAYDPDARAVTWALAMLPAQAEGLVTLVVSVAETIEPLSLIDNYCRIVGDETPAAETHVYSQVCPGEFAPLYIAKGDRLHGGCAQVGGTINYWIPYSNNSNPCAVHDVSLTDYLPGETEYISCTGSGSYDDVGHKVMWNLGTLDGGQWGSVDLLVRILDGTPFETVLTNRCEIVSEETPPAEVIANTSVCPEQFGPLHLRKYDGLGALCIDSGDTMTYVIVYDNSPNSAEIHNVILTDHLPSQVDHLSSSDGGVYDGSSMVTWYLGSLMAGVVDSVQVVVRVKPTVGPGQKFTNTAEITSDETWPVEALDSTEVCLSGFEHLSLSKTDIFGGSCVAAGNNIAYTISYSNPNPDTVHDVSIIDHLAARTDFISSAGGSYDSGNHTVTWHVGSLAGYSGDEVELIARVQSDTPAGFNLSNTCDITGTETGVTTVCRITRVCGTPSNPTGKVATHVESHASRTCSKNFPVITCCYDIQYTIEAHDVDVFPVFFDLEEYQGFDYSLAWPGHYSCAFISCSDLTIGGIARPGEGVSHAWYTCQRGPVALPGWAWICEPGPAQICVVPHPSAGGINIGDCSGAISGPIIANCAGIGGAQGDDPCTPTSTQSATWGEIKAMFK